MAEERAIRRNWRKIKEDLASSWQKVMEISFERGLLELDHMEHINSIQSPTERIDWILRKILLLRKAESFLEHLERNGFEEICRYVRGQSDVGDSEVVYTRSNTYTVESQAEKSTALTKEMSRLFDEKFGNLKELIIAGNDETRKFVDQKLDTRNKEMREFVDGKMQRVEDLHSNLKGIDTKNENLQGALQSAREKNNHLTKLAQEKTAENQRLTLQVLNLKETIDQLQRKPTPSSENLVLKYKDELERHKRELDELERTSKCEREELEKLRQKLDELNDAIEEKLKELEKVKGEFLTLMRENKDLKEKNELNKSMKELIEKLAKEFSNSDRFRRLPQRTGLGQWRNFIRPGGITKALPTIPHTKGKNK